MDESLELVAHFKNGMGCCGLYGWGWVGGAGGAVTPRDSCSGRAEMSLSTAVCDTVFCAVSCLLDEHTAGVCVVLERVVSSV